jgi:uncharacterized protein (DUF305 family)
MGLHRKPGDRRVALVVLASAMLVAAGACGGGEDHNDADVAFAQGMIPHHEQAITMSDLALAKANAAEVKALAGRIKSAQEPEIAEMEGWLEDWGEPVRSEGGGHAGHAGMDVGGVLTEAEMQRLEASSGPEFDRLFLEGMIRHHEGAITMARDEQTDGKFADAKELAARIITSQEAEIAEMRTLLAR